MQENIQNQQRTRSRSRSRSQEKERKIFTKDEQQQNFNQSQQQMPQNQQEANYENMKMNQIPQQNQQFKIDPSQNILNILKPANQDISNKEINEQDLQNNFDINETSNKINTDVQQFLDQNTYQHDGGPVPPHQQFNFRHARRLYVGNIPDKITQEYLTEWLYRSMEACGGLLEPGSPIIRVQIDVNLKFAFVEMRSIEEASAMLQLDGIILWNRALRIRRPTEYEKHQKVIGTRNIPQLDLSLLEGIGILIIPTQVENTPNKIFLANLPNTLDEYTILENLKLREHGDLKSFHLVKDNNTNESKGFAFFEYKDPSITDNVISALNGCSFYQRTLTCKRAMGDNGVQSSQNTKQGGQKNNNFNKGNQNNRYNQNNRNNNNNPNQTNNGNNKFNKQQQQQYSGNTNNNKQNGNNNYKFNNNQQNNFQDQGQNSQDDQENNMQNNYNEQ